MTTAPSITTRDEEPAHQIRGRAWRIALGYGLVATTWIVFSDAALALVVSDVDTLAWVGAAKGLGFVALTAGLLWILLARAFGQVADTVEALQAHETELGRVNGLHAALVAINQVIVRRPDRNELFDETCRALVERCGFSMAWIGWHDPETDVLVPTAHHGSGRSYLDQITVRTDEGPEGDGPSGTAWRSGAHHICNDMLDDPAMRPWSEAIAQQEFRSTASFPIFLDGLPRGMLNVYADEVDFFREAEVALLDETAGDLSFALDVERQDLDRRRAEAALQELNATLETKVADRTAELAESVHRAEAADRIKSAFLATMSHELRTPLNSIIGFTGIMSQGLAGPLNDEQSKQLGMVQTSARHLLALINDVLDISKIEAGQLVVDARPFELADAVSTVADVVRPLMGNKGLDMHVTVSADAGTVVGDRRRVEQILLNLLANAAKFTDDGDVRLLVERLPSAGSPLDVEAVRMSVADTGIGIAATDLVQLFQPFHQVDSGLTREHDGTGLGLAICRRLTTLMGGTIEVHSTPGHGSEFVVVLPVTPRDRAWVTPPSTLAGDVR